VKIKGIEKGELFEASCADIYNLIKLTGWQSKVTLEEGIKKVVDYEKRFLEGGLYAQRKSNCRKRGIQSN